MYLGNIDEESQIIYEQIIKRDYRLSLGETHLNKCALVAATLMPTLQFSVLSTTINPFHVTGLFLYPLKVSENVCFFMFARGIERY